MNICFIAPASSAHIVKWSRYFFQKCDMVYIINFTKASENIFFETKKDGENVVLRPMVYEIDINLEGKESDAKKLKYLTAGKKIKSFVDSINPDVISVHYATSYGTAVALSGIKHYILSCWGSDIYDFPKKSAVHKAMLEFSLFRASALFSTSKAMAQEAKKYTKKRFFITPFGVDTNLFAPNYKVKLDNSFLVGIVKSLEEKYGIKHLLEALSIILERREDINIKLEIYGKGSQKEELEMLCDKLNLADRVSFMGFVDQNTAAKAWASFDVSVIPSILDSESFGVSAVESLSCETPTIISNTEGLLEATNNGKCALVVNKENSYEIADAIIKLYDDRALRTSLGKLGREFVKNNFELDKNFSYIRTLFSRFAEYYAKDKKTRGKMQEN